MTLFHEFLSEGLIPLWLWKDEVIRFPLACVSPPKTSSWELTRQQAKWSSWLFYKILSGSSLDVGRILVDTRAEKFNFGIFRSQESSLRELLLWHPQWHVLVLQSFCFYILTMYVFMCVICILEEKNVGISPFHILIRTYLCTFFFLLLVTAAATSLQHFPFGLMVMNEKISRIFFLTVYTNMMMTYTKVMSFFTLSTTIL